MIDWRNFFQNYRLIDIKNNSDLLYQVGASVKGAPISEQQFIAMINDIKLKLNLSKDDILLDICCGNGVITYEIAKSVKYVVGIDGSAAYIKNAEKFKNRNNVKYILDDVTDFENIKTKIGDLKFTKVLFYSSLAYFTPDQLNQIICFLHSIITNDCYILIGSILDKSKKFKYFNTFKRWLHYFFNYLILNKDFGLGRWWSKKELNTIANSHNLLIDFLLQNPLLHTAHYRFDILLKKR